LSITEAKDECENLLSSDLFSNCSTVFINVNGEARESGRTKDMWDMAHSTSSEQGLMQMFNHFGKNDMDSVRRNNHFIEITNNWDESSVELFKKACYHIIDGNK